MENVLLKTDSTYCYKIKVYGIVQGVGFRPFVSRIATNNHIVGSVCNKGPFVEIFAQGAINDVQNFLYFLKEKAPKRSEILKLKQIEVELLDTNKFSIITSAKEKGQIFVSPDIAICPTCEKELFDKNDRRYLHPFINCTDCGPRLTILDTMPYDRERTSMGIFPMCEDCKDEYTNIKSRRYHAQPVCCNDCGPHLYTLLGKKCEDQEALIETRRVIRSGGIALIKGIGGYHLCCDATNNDAVNRLRDLKRRPKKPFAIMAKNLEVVKRECIIENNETDILDGPQKPIILLKRREHSLIADSVAPNNPNIGIMLPYAPVQMLLFDYPDNQIMSDCFVMTSGNQSGAPICRTDEDAIEQLSDMVDIILSNNREIRLRADDSVMSFFENKPYMIRRSRGYSPLPIITTKKRHGAVLAIGGELKNCFTLATDDLFYISPYIGDMADVRSIKALAMAIERMEELLEIKPTVVACDLHPKYNSSAFAKQLGLKVIEVQHHYAHIVSCMAENDIDED
ncbi:MAG: carbamoyltransferase HypF, partial [Spirochaetaceae bacterium]|nr:carbamoyltransferase HypF [Spirochaetaceae bacterium]